MNQNVRPTAAESRSGLILTSLVALWAAFVLIYYFSSIGLALDLIPSAFNIGRYPAVSFSQAFPILSESAFIILKTLFVVCLTVSWGCRVRRLFSLEPSNGWIKTALNFELGMVFLNFLWIGTGLVGIWYRPLALALGFLLISAPLLDILAFFFHRNHVFPKLFPREASYLFLFLIGASYWLFSAAHGLVPEAFYDSMVYHLAVPQYWLLHHGLCNFPTNFFSNYPYGGELFFMNGLVAQGTESAKLLHAAAFGFCALFAGGWAREWGGERAGWLALGLILTLPVFSINTGTTQVEGVLASALLPFLYFFLGWLKNEKHPMAWGVLAGLMMGLAFSIKYTSALVVGSAFLAMIVLRSSFLKEISLRQWVLFGAGALLLVGPWLVKNSLFTGNPFFPYLMPLFPGLHLTPESYERLLMEQRGRIAEGWQLLYLPWKAVMANPDGFNFVGPMALALVPSLFLFKLRNSTLKFLAVVSLLFFVSGFCVTHILRFLGTGFILLYTLLGIVLGGGDKPYWGKAVAVVGAISAIFCFGYLSAISAHYAACAGVWTGRQTREDYLMSPGKISPYFETALWVHQNLPPDARLLVAGDARGLYYERPFLTNSVFDEQVLPQLAREEAAPEGIARRLKELGVDDLVVNGAEGVRVSTDYHHYDLTPDQWKRLDDFIQKYTQLVYQKNLQGVYRILPTPVAPALEIPDFVLFFSQPASQFVKDAQKQQWGEAGEDLKQVLKLYPFSKFWREQKSLFDKSMAAAGH
jgi:hypothetical protein